MELYRCKWCRNSLPGKRVVTIGSGIRVYWVCTNCLKIGEKAAREAAKAP